MEKSIKDLKRQDLEDYTTRLASELGRSNSVINQLSGKISKLEQQVAHLEYDKQVLASQIPQQEQPKPQPKKKKQPSKKKNQSKKE